MRSTQQRDASPAIVIRGGGYSARVRAWPSEPGTAHLVLLDQRSAPPSSILRAWLNDLRDDGYTHVRTGAVHAEQRSPFSALGFESAQDLVLLHRKMAETRRPKRVESRQVRRARPTDLRLLADLDVTAFPDGWGLDIQAIVDAARATARHRIAVVDNERGQPVGYAVSGRSGQAAFLQRLAVEPAEQGKGVGRMLVADCLLWATRWRVDTVAVNTQDGNDRALGLYESMGFFRRPHGLTVMQRSLDGSW